ncbi:MAG TPA: T9SS type A sorting domain-containing protein [Bacteroidia bacterium]|nr:T9SS type A sorting domain-containing protein [Bacteroidia bacterium]
MKINSVISCTVSIFFSAVIIPLIATPQCTNQVTNLSGTSTVNGINVTVTDTGIVSSLTYCQGTTTPYYVGKNGVPGNGSYTFSFSPPVTGVTLNFSAISNVSFANEEIYLLVNGLHYAIPTLANMNVCEPMAVLTAAGNIGGCVTCGGSGCSGLDIPGPVSTITVVDSVITGDPNGTVFSIFICDSIQTGIDNLAGENKVLLFPNPLNNSLNITTAETGLLEIIVYDVVSNRLIQRSFLNSTSLNTEPLAKGIYLYEVRSKNGVIKNGKVVKE